VTDWDALCTRAAAQRIAGYALGALSRSRCAPASVLFSLQRLSAQTRAQAMLLDGWLTKLAAAMHQRDLAVMVLKGPALARTVYSSATLRPYDDLDLLVRPKDEDAAVELLTSWGFTETLDPPEERWARSAGVIPGFAPLHHQFHHPRANVVVELHTDPLQLGLRPACEDDRWRRATSLPDVPGCLMLSPEDQLVQLSVHANKHGYDRLIWLKDLDLVLRRQGETLDWRQCRATAKREGVVASVWYSLALAAHLFETPIPPPALASLRPLPLVRALYARTWPADAGGVHSKVGCRAVQFTPWESWRGILPSLVFMGRRGARMRAVSYAGALTLAKQWSRAARRDGAVARQSSFQALRAPRLG